MASKFEGLFEAVKEPQSNQVVVRPSSDAGSTAAPSAVTYLTPGRVRPLDPEPTQAVDRPATRTGRPANGKKSDPNYRQVTAYVRRDLYREVTFALHEDARRRDTRRVEFSELVDSLLERWWRERSAPASQAGQPSGNADFRVREIQT
jgi:hypothetical protein